MISNDCDTSEESGISSDEEIGWSSWDIQSIYNVSSSKKNSTKKTNILYAVMVNKNAFAFHWETIEEEKNQWRTRKKRRD